MIGRGPAALGEPLSRAASALGAAILLASCASGPLDSARAFASVKRPPAVVALQGQSQADQEWDVKDCQAEAGYRTNWSPTDSPLANLLLKLFFWGTAGAAVGGTIDGPFPLVVDNSTATLGLNVGASTGG